MSSFHISFMEHNDIEESAKVLSLAMLHNPLHIAVFKGNGETERTIIENMFSELYHTRPGIVIIAKVQDKIVGVMRINSCVGKKDAAESKDPIDVQDINNRQAFWLNEWAKRDPKEQHWHLGPIGVLPSYRKQGVGSQLMNRLSSTFQNQRAVLQRIINAVSGMDLRCLLTLGPAMAKETFQIPENVHVLPSIPHSQVFPHADAVVTHAGHGTVMRALAYGLPLVCLPMGRDQIDNAALVAHHGAGLKLRSKARSNQIGKAIKRVLNDPGFATNAHSLQQSILADAKANLAVRHLEDLTSNDVNGSGASVYNL